MRNRAQKFLAAADAALAGRSIRGGTAHIYALVRLWHWANAAAILVLSLTGYLIGTGTPAIWGMASGGFLFGYIRFAHFSAGYVLSAGFLLRIYWALMGNAHAMQIFCVPLWRRCSWRELHHEIRRYSFLAVEPERGLGHNRLAQLAMFFMFTQTITFMVVTGFALYGQGAGTDSWQYKVFGWVFSLWPNSQDFHTWHHLGLWVIVMFALVHIYAVLWDDVVSRRSFPSIK
ncbi:Ni/Fe-hydrogenase, b-type cytochrome subunit [Bradyrhizobium japonicum]|uniref:Ni/Fe-hydrogenase, b-type cytochrome subunit n=2 Tax=Nitrobacteraceae TaxID=41294 RepID=UPI0004886A2F|nr:MULTISPECIES: Ni/Fe-hydrogenase, b-type cytochrome subunit [Bradyrhizobium]MBR1004717.1 Ni/Fe-hydrogenase, b-type cytochrome subunit [Bradyrhizobium liaoningense]MCP1855489.1 Ni/Fe-hydrogenase 1 B-type cytochrome subunit [Bradyrhizobium japonicum]WLB96391.1 Ni/Fe-hydrogenase, b-type cytochrome subunit [Bradyrhizobium japonicum USDA 123]